MSQIFQYFTDAKLQRLFLIVLLAVLTRPALAQTQTALDTLKKINALVFEGKDKEAIALHERLISGHGRKYAGLAQNNARLYENTGDYTKADEILRQALDKAKHNPNGATSYQIIVNQLSKLYEKMGDDGKAEAILEQLIASEYGRDTKATNDSLNAEINRVTQKSVNRRHLNEKKSQYIKRSIAAYKKRDSSYRAMVAAQYLKNCKNDTAKARNDPNYKNIVNRKFDSLAEVKTLENQWTADSIASIRASNTYSSTLLSNSIARDALAKAIVYNPTAQQIAQLRSGEFKFVSAKNELSGSWQEVQRLFTIYERQHNYKAAEALIKQAIASDDRMAANQTANSDTANSLYKIYHREGWAHLANIESMNGMSTMMEQSIAAHDKHSGIDIFYVQNKAFLAELYKGTGNPMAYRLLTDTIYKLCKKFEPGTNPFVLNLLGETYLRLGKYPDAEHAYQKIVAAHPTNYTELNMFSKYYLTALSALAKTYQIEGENDRAESVLKQALAYDKETGREACTDHLNTVIDLARLYENTGRFNAAEQYCNQEIDPVLNNVRDNFDFLSEEEKILWLNNQISAFDLAASLLLTDKHPLNDFLLNTCNQQLLLKGVVLNDEQGMMATLRNSGNSQLKQLVNDWQSNRSAIAWQYSQPLSAGSKHIADSLTIVANDEEKKINGLSSSFHESLKNQDIDFRKIQSALKNDEAAIEFVRFNYYHKKWTDTIKYGAFVILPNDDKPHFVSLCNESRLADLLDSKNGSSPLDFYGDSTVNIKNGKRNEVLYDLVWKPIDSLLKGIHKVAISPAGLLNRIAFSALPANGNGFLVDRYELRQYASIREITAKTTETGGGHASNVILYGGINFDSADTTASLVKSDAEALVLSAILKKNVTGGAWDYLPGSLDEVNRISALFKVNRITTQVYTGSEATEQSLKQLTGHSPGILHLATHGFSLPNAEDKSAATPDRIENQFTLADNPMFRSGIIMAGANRVWSGAKPGAGKEDGIVTAYELSNLDFSHTELVVLSACETALGDIKGTEGVFGLQRAFKLAGVKNMLLSLWKIPDAQTSELMEHFYTNKVGGMDNYQALHAAQEQMKKKYPPYFWSSFELIE